MKKKWEINLYSFYDISGMEQHFEKMARKGWSLEKLSAYGLVYHECAPRDTRYAVLYTPSHSNFDPGPDQEQEALTEMSAYDGWTLVGQRDQMMVYCNDDPQAVAIDTDAVAQVDGLARMAKKVLWVWWTALIVLALLLHFYWAALRYNPITFLSQSIRIVFFLVGVLLLLYFAAELIGWYAWHKKAKIMAEGQGEFLKTRGNHALLGTIMVVGVVGLAYILVTGTSPAIGLNLVFFGLAWVVAVPLINGLRRHLQKRGVAWNLNVFTTVVLALVIFELLRLGCGTMMKELTRSTAPEPMLTQEMLTGEGSTNKTYTMQTSGFVTRAEYRENDIGRDFSYLLLDVNLPGLYERGEEEMLHHHEGWGTAKLVYQAADSGSWHAEEAWQLFNRDKAVDTYLLRWGRRLVEVSFTEGFTQEQRDIVYSVFGK